MTLPRPLAALCAVGFLALSFAPSAAATITPTATALQVAQAMFTNPAIITSASWIAKPPSGTPDAVADAASALAGFPTSGNSYGILTTGDANLAPTSNCCTGSGTADGGGNVRGNTDFDVTILKIDFTVQSGNCLSVGNFRFLSDEFPEYVNTSFNDAFIAELDTTSWTTVGSAISAPNDFALDAYGHVISINAAGAASMSASNAAGTTYDGATPMLKLSSPITPGAHSLYLSIFDQGDSIYDSAVFIDNIGLSSVPPEDCHPGIEVAPVHATCEAWGIRAIERDLTTGQVVGDSDVNLSHTAANVTDTAGSWPAPAPTPGAAPSAPNPTQAHADAQAQGFDWHHGASQIDIHSSTTYSRCDVAAVRDRLRGQYTQAFGQAGLENFTLRRAGNVLLHADALDFRGMAVGTPGRTFFSGDCKLAAVDIAPPLISTSQCPPAWTTPVDQHQPPVHVAVTLNEQWAASAGGGGQTGYGGDAAHICILIDSVTRIDIYIGLVNLSVAGGGVISPPVPRNAPCVASSEGDCPPGTVGKRPVCVKGCDASSPLLPGGVTCPDPQPTCPPPFGGTLPDCTFTPECPPTLLGSLNCNDPPCTLDPNDAITVQCTLPPIAVCPALPPVICDSIQPFTARGATVELPARASRSAS